MLGEDERVLEAPFRLDRDVLQFSDAGAAQLRPLFQIPRPALELAADQVARRALPHIPLEAPVRADLLRIERMVADDEDLIPFGMDQPR